MKRTYDIFGRGIYTPRRVAMLVGGTPQEVLRWTRGSGPNDPLWRGHYQFLDNSADLSFRDLIEIRVVKSLRKAGVSLQAIRAAIRIASERFGVEKPLLNRAFVTDGSEILMDALEDDGDYVSLSKKRPGQKAFSTIIATSLKDLEYDADEVSRWRPSNHGRIVLDPARAFGEPIIDLYSISTSMICDELKAGQTVSYLARVYEISPTDVRAADRFEGSIAA